MVHRTRGDRGQLEIDVRLTGFGRFRCSAQTPRATVLHRRVLLARLLAEQGQFEVLRALKARRLAWSQVEEAQKKQRLADAALMTDLLVKRPLWPAIEATLPKMGRSERTQESYRVALNRLRVVAQLGDEATVADLMRDDWAELLEAWTGKSAATKNSIRRGVSRFLTRYLGDKLHPFRRAVLAEDRWPWLKVRKRIRGIPADQFWPLMAKVPKRLVPCFVTLAASGMRVGEYLNDAQLELDDVNHMIYPEGKTGPKEYAVDPSLWHYVRQAVPCRICRMTAVPKRLEYDPRYKKLYRALRDAGETLGLAVTIHDLRRFYVRTGVEAVGQSKTQDAVGHATAAMTQDYARWHTKHEVAQAVAQALVMSGKKSGKVKSNRAARR
jgi:integrase